MRTKRSIFVLAVIGTLAVCTQLASPASARWAYGDGPSDIDIHVDGAPTSNDVCANHISGRVGASDIGDPATFVAPPGPYGTRTVQLYVSDQLLTGAQVEAGGLRRTDGVLVPPSLVQITGQLQSLNPFETYDGGGTNIVYASAAFSFVPPDGSIPVGSYLAVKSTSAPAFAQARAIACDPYVPPTEPTTAPPVASSTTTTGPVTTTTLEVTTTTGPVDGGPGTVPEVSQTYPPDTFPSVPSGDVMPAQAAVPVYGSSTFTG